MDIQDSYLTQDKYWSDYVKRDRCFLSDTDTAFDEDQVHFARTIFENIDDKDVLEIGCGDGADLLGIVKKYNCNSVVGIDIAADRVALCKKNVETAKLSGKVNVFQMDAQELKFDDNSFDVIYCNSVLLFLDRDRFFPEIIRVLRPGGRLFLFGESLNANPILRFYRSVWRSNWKRNAEKYANRLSVKEIDTLGNQYFADVNHREFYLFFAIICRIGPWLINRIIRGKTWYETTSCKGGRYLDAALLTKYPKLREYAWLAVVCFSDPKKK